MIGKIVNNQIVLPPNNAGNKFNVNLDSEWLEANSFRELAAEEITAANTAAETARQTAKPLKLKQAENAFFVLIDTLNAAENLGITHTDNPDAVLQKGAALSMTQKAYYGTLLQNAVHEIEINGGSWSDLPNAPHNL